MPRGKRYLYQLIIETLGQRWTPPSSFRKNYFRELNNFESTRVVARVWSKKPFNRWKREQEMTEVNGNAIRPRYDFTREECGLYQSPAKSPVGSQTTGLRTRFRSETWPNRRVSRMLVERRPKRPRFERTLPFASRRRESRWYPPTLGKLKRRGSRWLRSEYQGRWRNCCRTAANDGATLTTIGMEPT